MNSTEKFCVDSTLSAELNRFNLSLSVYSTLLGVCVFNCLLSPVAVLGNGLVLFVILKFSSLHTKSNILIFALAVTDILVGLVVQPSFTVYIASKLKMDFSCEALMSYLYTEIFCLGLSILMLTLICSDRYYAIVYPYKYLAYVTKRCLFITVAVVWAAWLLFNVVCRALKVKNDEFFSPVASVIITVSLSLNIVLNFKIYRIVKLHKTQIQAQKRNVLPLQIQQQHEGCRQDVEVSKMGLHENSLAISVLLISGVLILCYLPLMLISVADMISENDDLFDHVFYPIAETITFLNSSLNPFLYCLRFKELRMKVREILVFSPSS